MKIHLEKIMSAISFFLGRCLTYHVFTAHRTFQTVFLYMVFTIPIIGMMLPVTLPVFWLIEVSHSFPCACLISLAGMAIAEFILVRAEKRYPSVFKKISTIQPIKFYVIYYILSLTLTFLYLIFCLVLLHFLITVN